MLFLLKSLNSLYHGKLDTYQIIDAVIVNHRDNEVLNKNEHPKLLQYKIKATEKIYCRKHMIVETIDKPFEIWAKSENHVSRY